MVLDEDRPTLWTKMAGSISQIRYGYFKDYLGISRRCRFPLEIFDRSHLS